MLNKKEFERIRKDMDKFEKVREDIIQKSRKIINISKRMIYALHRNDIKSASEYVVEIEKEKKALEKINIVSDVNINMVAVQEYVEAICYYHFIKSKKIPTAKEIKVDNESYLMGLCDLTGELGRKAVNEVINKNFKGAYDIKNLVEEIYGEFLKFNLRNGELRKKSDSIKWNLKKLEDIVYELKLKDKLK